MILYRWLLSPLYPWTRKKLQFLTQWYISFFDEWLNFSSVRDEDGLWQQRKKTRCLHGRSTKMLCSSLRRALSLFIAIEYFWPLTIDLTEVLYLGRCYIKRVTGLWISPVWQTSYESRSRERLVWNRKRGWNWCPEVRACIENVITNSWSSVCKRNLPKRFVILLGVIVLLLPGFGIFECAR